MEKYQWYKDAPLVPSSRYLSRPKDMTPLDYQVLYERVESFHRQIADLGDRWEEAGPLPPFTKASASSHLSQRFGHLGEVPLDLEYYDFPPAFMGRGWANHDPRFPPEYLEPQVEWTKMLTLDLQRTLRNAVDKSTLLNHCYYYGLNYYSFLNFIREDMPEVKNIPLRIRGGYLLDRIYLTGERVRLSDEEAVQIYLQKQEGKEWLFQVEDHIGISWDSILERKGDMERLVWERKQKEVFSAQ